MLISFFNFISISRLNQYVTGENPLRMMTFSIKELENFSGIKAHTIRTWEQRFNFLQPQRSEGLRRLYTLDELRLLLNVAFLNRNGFRVSAIAKLASYEMNERLSPLISIEQKQQAAVNQLILAMAGMDAAAFETVLESCMISWDITTTINKVIIPFIQKVGLLEEVSSKPALLLVEQSIKQKIIVGIENAGSLQKEKTALFFLTRKNTELGLLFHQYQMRLAGFTTFYISTPASVSQLIEIAKALRPEFIVSSRAGKTVNFNKEQFIQLLEQELPHTRFLNLSQPQLKLTADGLPFEDVAITVQHSSGKLNPVALTTS